MADPKIIWLISDNKRGHENQSAGLVRALAKHLPVNCIRIDIATHKASWLQALRGQFPFATKHPKPDLILGAGSQTHSTLLAAGRATKAPTLLIMAPPPGLTRFFDLCVIPEHDQRSGSNVITTRGAMNLIEAGKSPNAHAGLILIGGPSQHHGWDEAALLKQVEAILSGNSHIQWTLTTSRRTPQSTTEQLLQCANSQLTVVPVEQTDAAWLPDELSKAAYVWVSEDSVSMVYEALSSGAKVGVLPVPRKNPNSRIIRGLDSLKAQGHISSYDTKRIDLSQFQSQPPLDEAGRIATIVAERFF